MSERRGFSLYLTFLVTSVLFILVTATYDISRISLDLGHSDCLEAITFHAADGGLERALGKLHQKFESFELKYTSLNTNSRIVVVTVDCVKKQDTATITSVAKVINGKKVVAIKQLSRIGVKNISSRQGNGKFMEAS